MDDIVLWYDTIDNGVVKNNFQPGAHEIENFFNDNVGLPNLLIKNNIDFIISTSSYGTEYFYTKYSTLKSFYPIEMGSYFGNANTNQLPINEKWFLKKINNNAEIIFWYPTEGFVINRKSEALNGLFDLIHTKYPSIKIRFVFGDFYKSSNIPDYVNYKCFKNFFWYDTISSIKKPTLDTNKQSRYDFISLNRKYRVSRYMVFSDLENSNMLKNAFYTNLTISSTDPVAMLDQFRKFYTVKEDDSFFDRIQTDKFIKELNDINATIFDKKPSIDVTLTDLDFTNTSYLEVVNETNFDSSTNLFITEKTYRAIAIGHIFLICGQRGTLRHLKRQGFQTFDDLFDESYDDIVSFAKRWEIIKKNLQLWMSMSESAKRDYYKKSFDKLVHNQTLLYSRNFKKEILELFED